MIFFLLHSLIKNRQQNELFELFYRNFSISPCNKNKIKPWFTCSRVGTLCNLKLNMHSHAGAWERGFLYGLIEMLRFIHKAVQILTLPMVLFMLLISTDIYAKIEVYDDAGQLISLIKPAQTIISLSPGLTELVYSAGGATKIIAAVSFSNFPQQAKKLPSVGSYNALDIEQILRMKPDLIIAWKTGNSSSQIEQLKKLGLKIYISEPESFNDIPETVKKIGKLMGTEKFAEKNARQFIEQLNNLKNHYKALNQKDKKNTFIQIWDNPVMSINNEHLISKVISFCGGKNIFDHATSLTYSPDIESILKHNPEIIIATGMANISKTWLDRWNQWPYLSAVKNKRLYHVNPDHLVRHTLRIILGIKEVCQLIQPQFNH